MNLLRLLPVIFSLLLLGAFQARLALVLGAVALFTGLSGLVFRSQDLRRLYNGNSLQERTWSATRGEQIARDVLC